jgi:hypothetical protein
LYTQDTEPFDTLIVVEFVPLEKLLLYSDPESTSLLLMLIVELGFIGIIESVSGKYTSGKE